MSLNSTASNDVSTDYYDTVIDVAFLGAPKTEAELSSHSIAPVEDKHEDSVVNFADDDFTQSDLEMSELEPTGNFKRDMTVRRRRPRWQPPQRFHRFLQFNKEFRSRRHLSQRSMRKTKSSKLERRKTC